jgi:hypothetical protein
MSMRMAFLLISMYNPLPILVLHVKIKLKTSASSLVTYLSMLVKIEW